MPPKSYADSPKSLKTRALEVISKRHGLIDAILVDAAEDIIGSTREAIYRFRAVSAAHGNEQYEVVLNAAGEELKLADISRREGVSLFPFMTGPSTGPAGSGGIPGTITINPTDNKLVLKQGDTFNETITVTVTANAGTAGLKNVKLVASGATAPFVTSISPAAGYGPLPGGKPQTLLFEVVFTGVEPCKSTDQVFNGTLDVVADGTVVAQKRVEITVPACIVEISYSYSVKFVCGVQTECDCACSSVRPGAYATEINIYNHNSKEVAITKLVVPVVLAGAPAGREPNVAHRRAEDKIVLPPHTATMDDCCRIAELLFGAAPQSVMPLSIGFLEIVSPVELSVTAVYTATSLNSTSVNIDVEQIVPKLIRR